MSTQSKHFVDTIKMIAYRAETAMVQTLREKIACYDDARSLLRAVYSSEIDLLPNAQEKTLTVRFRLQTRAPMTPSAIYAPNSTVPSCSFQAPIYARPTNWSHRTIGEIRRSELTAEVRASQILDTIGHGGLDRDGLRPEATHAFGKAPEVPGDVYRIARLHMGELELQESRGRQLAPTSREPTGAPRRNNAMVVVTCASTQDWAGIS